MVDNVAVRAKLKAHEGYGDGRPVQPAVSADTAGATGLAALHAYRDDPERGAGEYRAAAGECGAGTG